MKFYFEQCWPLGGRASVPEMTSQLGFTPPINPDNDDNDDNKITIIKSNNYYSSQSTDKSDNSGCFLARLC